MTDIKLNSDRYVYFNSNGEITKITNYKDLNEENITVSFSEVENIISGSESSMNFLVLYDNYTKKFVLKKKSLSSVSNIKGFIYEISMDEINPELVITQDLKNKKWKISLTSMARELLKTENQNVLLSFSITERDNPNKLFRILRITLGDLIEKNKTFKFQDELEYTSKVSIYTVKQLTAYKHEVING